jgi:hypothetical protein
VPERIADAAPPVQRTRFSHITIGGVTRLYVLDRDYRTSISTPPALTSAIDNLGLIVTPLSNDPKGPLTGFNSNVVVQDGGGNFTPYTPNRTNGLFAPDGIMAVVPGSSPTTILYTSKIKGGDNTGPTTMPPSQQCGAQPYNATGTSAPKKANHDLVTHSLGHHHGWHQLHRQGCGVRSERSHQHGLNQAAPCGAERHSDRSRRRPLRPV